MIDFGGHRLILGGFHDHWWRADGENPSLLLAAMNYYHYDFVTLMDGPEHDRFTRDAAAAFSSRTAIYPGREEMFGWGHVVTVGPRAPKLESDNPDYRAVLRQLKNTCDLVFLAHPNYPGTWEQLFLTGEMDRLLDEGLIDGVNLINTGGFDYWGHRELIAWFHTRDAMGKHTPVVGGWDAHLLNPVDDLPPVLYTSACPPRGHIDTCGNNRTILIAADNSYESIVAAVKQGHTLIEDLQTGELLGRRDLVEMLQQHGYSDAIKRLDEIRDSVGLTVERTWTAGAPGHLTSSWAGRLLLPRSFTQAEPIPVAADGPVAIVSPPPLLERDDYYVPVAWHGDDGGERIWAVRVDHPIQMDLLPLLSPEGPALDVVPARSFSGTVEVELEHESAPIISRITGRAAVPLGKKNPPLLPLAYRARTCNNGGAVRVLRGHLTFFSAPRFTGDFSAVPSFDLNERRYVPGSAFGTARCWPGPDFFSGRLRFAWTDAYFLMEVDVRDQIHFQPFHGHYLYNGDSLQLAIDPLLRRRDTKGHVYCLNLGLTDNGPEVYRWLSPVKENVPGFIPPPQDVSLGSSYLEVEQTSRGLRYVLRLPWDELAPVQPAAGTRLGIYFIMFNNNGHGHVGTLHWPVPVSGMWLIPRKWGVLTLAD